MKFFTKAKAIIGPRGETSVDDVLRILERNKATDIEIENGIVRARVALSDVSELRRVANVFIESPKTV